MGHLIRKPSVPDNLIFQFDPNNKLGGNTTNTKNIVDPTITGTFVNGMAVVNGEFTGDGVDDYIDTNMDLVTENPASITIDAWVFRTTGNNNFIISKTTNGSNSDWTLFFQTSQNIRLSGNGGSFGGNTSNNSVLNDRWTNITVIIEGGVDARMYVNGQFDVTVPTSSYNLANGAHNVMIAALVSGGIPSFPNPDKFSIVRLYDGVMAAADIELNYESLKHRFGL